jgi:hypothetical protein
VETKYPENGRITSLGIGREVPSRKRRLNNPRYPALEKGTSCQICNVRGCACEGDGGMRESVIKEAIVDEVEHYKNGHCQ